MLEAVHRRTFLNRLAALGIVGSSFFAKHADAATSAIVRQIDEMERRCLGAQRAFEDALTAFEANLPPLHWTLDLTEQSPRRFRWRLERGFDGSTPKRYVNAHGYPDHRHVATVESANEDLDACDWEDRRRRKLIRRMIRRAQRRDEAIEQAEATYGLEERRCVKFQAEREIEELCKAIFEKPATTYAAVQVQARMLCAYTACINEQWATYQAGLRGATLAASLQNLERAA